MGAGTTFYYNSAGSDIFYPGKMSAEAAAFQVIPLQEQARIIDRRSLHNLFVTIEFDTLASNSG
jgi:hypothetical protein